MLITLIGSSSISQETANLQAQIGFKLASLGWHGRSGAAGGSDTNFLIGFAHYAVMHNKPLQFTNVIPWPKFKDTCITTLQGAQVWREDMVSSFVVADQLPHYDAAVRIAEDLHPAWERCSQGAKKLHTRNVYQVLGWDGQAVAKRCWFAAPEHNGVVKGGTATAVALARNNNVETLNIEHPEARRQIANWL